VLRFLKPKMDEFLKLSEKVSLKSS
jgi:hypothetical protein